MGLVQSMIEMVTSEMERHQVLKLKAVHLAIGQLACVVPAQLASCFEILTENTNLAGAALMIKTIPVRYRCRACQEEFPAEGISLSCALCNATHPELISGRELQVEYLEVVD